MSHKLKIIIKAIFLHSKQERKIKKETLCLVEGLTCGLGDIQEVKHRRVNPEKPCTQLPATQAPSLPGRARCIYSGTNSQEGVSPSILNPSPEIAIQQRMLVSDL